VLAEVLLREPRSPVLATLARPALRAMVRDRALHGRGLARQDLEHLAGISGEPAVRAARRCRRWRPGRRPASAA